MTDSARAAKFELKAYRTAQHELVRLEEEIANVRARLASTSRPARDVDIQQSRDPKATEALLAALADLTVFYAAKRVKTAKLCLHLERRIDRVAGVHALLLRMHYIDELTMEQIAARLEYSKRQILRFHLIAIEEYAKMAPHVTGVRDNMAM